MCIRDSGITIEPHPGQVPEVGEGLRVREQRRAPSVPAERLRLPRSDGQVLLAGQELQHGLGLARNEPRCRIVNLPLDALTGFDALTQRGLDPDPCLLY